MAQVHNVIDLLATLFPIAVLAVVLAVVGYQVRTFLNNRAASRADKKIQESAAVAAARRAHARQMARQVNA